MTTRVNGETAGGGTGAYLPLAGGAMAGSIDMNAHALSDLPNPAAPQDAATQFYVDSTVGMLPVTTAQRLALTPYLWQRVIDTDLRKMLFWDGSVWNEV